VQRLDFGVTESTIEDCQFIEVAGVGDAQHDHSFGRIPGVCLGSFEAALGFAVQVQGGGTGGIVCGIEVTEGPGDVGPGVA